MPIDVVLIGPINAGKSTISELLSARLNLPQCSMDEHRWDYYKEIGYDEEIAKQRKASGGLWSVGQYWKPFEAHAATRLLADYQDCVIDFGAGYSVYEEEALFQKVSHALKPYPNVVLLLPSPDLDESLSILHEREPDLSDSDRKVNEHFVRHVSNYKLAKFIVYTKGKTPQETCDEILDSLSLTAKAVE